MEYLDFELPIKELEDQLDKCQIIGSESDVDVSDTCKQIEKKLEEHTDFTEIKLPDINYTYKTIGSLMIDDDFSYEK